jgi:hypothetical protein
MTKEGGHSNTGPIQYEERFWTSNSGPVRYDEKGMGDHMQDQSRLTGRVVLSDEKQLRHVIRGNYDESTEL